MAMSRQIFRYNEDMINRFSRTVLSRKCEEESSKLRARGDDIYKKLKHDSVDHVNMLEAYTRCLNFAPNNSEELALSYSSRSNVLLHLMAYEECLLDVERALKITNSSELKNKLMDRKKECLSQLENTKKSENKFEQSNSKKSEIIKFIPSKKIPCASEAISLKYDQQYGRHLVATRDIRPGEIIIKEKHYITFQTLEDLNVNCNHCTKFTLIGIPCDTCSFVSYCSEKCKNEAWQQYHDVECRVIPYYCVMVIPYTSECTKNAAATRLFIKDVKQEGLNNIISDVRSIGRKTNETLNEFFQNGIFQSYNFRSFYNLSKAHLETSTQENEDFFKMTIHLLYDKSDILNIRSNDANEIEETKSFLGDKVTSISLLHSLLNHSCYPNTGKVATMNGEIIHFTTRPIKEGEQIYDNYDGLYLNKPKEIRQKSLKDKYDFICDCKPCKESWPYDYRGIIEESLFQDCFKKLINLPSVTENISNKQIYFFFGEEIKNWPYDENTLEKVKKIIEIINTDFEGYKAFIMEHRFVGYIKDYFFNLLKIEDDVIAKCVMFNQKVYMGE